MFHFLVVTSLLCSRLRLSLPLFLTSLYYPFKVSIVALSVCFVPTLSLKGFHCFIIWLLRHGSVLGFDCLFLCSNVTILSLQCFHCCIICLLRHHRLFLKGFHCFIICLLRHCSVLGFDCLFFCLLHTYILSSRFSLFHYLFVTSLYYLFNVSIVLLSVYYATALV